MLKDDNGKNDGKGVELLGDMMYRQTHKQLGKVLNCSVEQITVTSHDSSDVDEVYGIGG
jgi:hypothetical protein